MAALVKLYVYDLSNGMARQLSQQLTGRLIEGIWHTSVVVFGKEIFYGQGINTTLPGRSHHGAPLRVIDMGETLIDEDTFNEYLTEMSDHYTADKYHLLDFNCNSFTSDVVGFLTGGTIPDYIKDLPTDFLSTPFGAALRPTIDAMFQRPTSGAPTPPIPPPTPAANTSPDPQLAASILSAVASQAQSSLSPNVAPSAATQTLTAPIHAITNPSSFHSFLRNHTAAVAFFTATHCGPCRMIEPIFERLSEEKGIKADGRGAGFAKIDIGVGLGNALASEWGVRATPTFMFFLNGKKLDEIKGADASELRTQVDLLLFQAFPPHPHTSLPLPAIQALSLNPILFTQVPAIDTVLSKLSSFMDSTSWPQTQQPSEQVKRTLSMTVAPYLKARFAAKSLPPSSLPSASQGMLTSWGQATSTLASVLPAASLFPLVDLWRLALLDPSVGAWSSTPSSNNPVSIFLDIAIATIKNPDSAANARNYLLTVLRLLSNAFATPTLSRAMFLTQRAALAGLVIPCLLHSNSAVRTAASSLTFNIASFLQKGRVAKVKGNTVDVQEDEDWEVEMVSAVVEALDRENASEEVVHRLTASLAFLLRLSPAYDTQISPLLEVLQARAILKRKLDKGGCGEQGVVKKDVRKLVEEVANKLCP